jgi:hypothetical protein
MAETTAAGPPRRHRVLVTVLLVLAVVVGFVGVFSVWLNRQALNTDNWTKTSGRLLADEHIQRAVSAYMVDELFSSVDVAGAIRQALPDQADALAGPAAAGLQELAGRVAPQLLASPQVQDAWQTANRFAHAQLMTILRGGSDVVTTTGGEVVLNLHPLVDRLAATIGVEDQVAAARSKLQGSTGSTARALAQQKLGITLPPQSGRIVIMRSDQLSLAQDISSVVRHLAVWSTAITVLLFALAVWLAQGWRRVALRRAGWCFFGVGLVVLLARRVGGNSLVDALVASESVKPAVHSAWTIGTTLLHDIAVALVLYGVVLVAAAWLGGATRPAVALRRDLAPALRYHLASVYGAVALLFLLFLAWGPTPATRKPVGILLFAVLIVLGVEVLRRQVAREHPDAARSETAERWRARLAGMRSSASGAASGVAAGTSRMSLRRPSGPPPPDPLADLERIATLHDRGALTDEEFAAQKLVILSRA